MMYFEDSFRSIDLYRSSFLQLYSIFHSMGYIVIQSLTDRNLDCSTLLLLETVVNILERRPFFLHLSILLRSRSKSGIAESKVP